MQHEMEEYDEKTTLYLGHPRPIHVKQMRENPDSMFDFYMKEMLARENTIKDWERRFNALTEEMLSGRDRFQPVTDVRSGGASRLFS